MKLNFFKYSATVDGDRRYTVYYAIPAIWQTDSSDSEWYTYEIWSGIKAIAYSALH